MPLGMEFLQASREGLATRDSSLASKFITDDFEMITTFRTMPSKRVWTG